ncbi:hypothetical protein VCHA29O37_390065 [Vibrio chagasii]|nr:hypothetical protein VCHA29O37_390065 [Vibrio chagasii]
MPSSMLSYEFSKTELYCRKVLGRILRVNSSEVQHAWLFTFAEPNLIEFAERIEDDIQESCIYAHMREQNKPQIPIQRNASSNSRSLLKRVTARMLLGEVTVPMSMKTVSEGV